MPTPEHIELKALGDKIFEDLKANPSLADPVETDEGETASAPQCQ